MVDNKRSPCGDNEWGSSGGIHESHAIKAVKGDVNAFYCNRCGAWNTGGPLKSMSKPCIGHVATYRQFQYRLLCLGVIPARGAKTPGHAKRRFS